MRLLCFLQFVILASSVSVPTANNTRKLEKSLLSGWKIFCATDIDATEAENDATIHFVTMDNEIVILSTVDYSKMASHNIDRNLPTLLYVNAFVNPYSYFGVQSHLQYLQKSQTNFNLIIVDFVKDLLQLYYTVRDKISESSQIVANIIETLTQMGINPENISIVGHSVGANIAAMGANKVKESNGINIGQLIAIDPASMCRPEDVSVHANISSRVVVIHGDGGLFGIRNTLGTIDIYPNGIGNAPIIQMQPGCTFHLCNHMFPFLLFMESLIEKVEISSVKCNSWLHFRSANCDYNNIVNIGLSYPKNATGTFFCLTQPNPPYTLQDDGLRYSKLKANKQNLSLE